MSAAELLDRLEATGRKPKKTGKGRWLACCPAHGDRSPSLSIRELDDGRTLINDFGGCGAIQVLEALGLDWSALYPERQGDCAPSHSRIPSRDLLTIIADDSLLVWIIAQQLLAGQPMTEEIERKLTAATGRIQTARVEAMS